MHILEYCGYRELGMADSIMQPETWLLISKGFTVKHCVFSGAETGFYNF